MPPGTVDALAHRPLKRLFRPAADAGIAVRRDVGGVDLAERRLERTATGQEFAALRRVADTAIADGREFTATLDQGFLEGRGRIRLKRGDLRPPRIDEKHQSQKDNEEQRCQKRFWDGHVPAL